MNKKLLAEVRKTNREFPLLGAEAVRNTAEYCVYHGYVDLVLQEPHLLAYMTYISTPLRSTGVRYLALERYGLPGGEWDRVKFPHRPRTTPDLHVASSTSQHSAKASNHEM